MGYAPHGSQPDSGTAFEPIPLVNERGHAWFSQDSVKGAAGWDDGYKLFANASTSWIAHASISPDRLLLVKVFKLVAPGKAAPGEANIEIYSTRLYEEVENQGPLQEVSQSQSVEYTVCWYMDVLPADVAVVPGDAKLLNIAKGIAALGCV